MMLYLAFVRVFIIRVLLHVFILMTPRPPSSTLFPYTTLFRSCRSRRYGVDGRKCLRWARSRAGLKSHGLDVGRFERERLARDRSEEHTSELQSRRDLVCRLLLEKKKPNLLRQI